jgi:murein L,D-transpeptidase YcbB/YkuD
MRNVGLSPSPAGNILTGSFSTGPMLAASLLAMVLLLMAPASSRAAPMQAPVTASVDADTGGISLRGTLDAPPAATDTPIADKLHAIVTARPLNKHAIHADERKAMEQFYAARQFAPLWLDDGHPTANATATVARLKDAAAEGLDPTDYPVPDFDAAADAEALASSDIALTQSVLTFARHLAAGRIAPTRVLAEVDYGNHTPEPGDILETIADSRDIDATFDGFDPPADGFKALKGALGELRSHAARADLKPAGPIDDRTLTAINGPGQQQKIDTVIANMERWRWLPHDLGPTYVMVNIPDYTLRVMHDGKAIWTTKIVAGKPQTPTPLLTAAMDTVIVNPSWHVPQSIIQNELLPRYASDPQIFDRLGLAVKHGANGQITVVQPPGAANALGRIKFNFPNKFQVYLHDTPEKRLFAAGKRAFSHGCMRVEDPTQFGEIMLHLTMNGETPTSRELYGMFGRDEHTFKLTTRPFVHLSYQTAFVDDAGTLQWRDDIYGLDARIYSILHGAERRIADVPPPRDPNRDQASLQGRQEILSRVERREAANPYQYFQRLFR